MSDRRREPPVDYETLAELLSALAYPMRLELMGLLRFPHTLGEIRISPHRVEPGGNPDRPAAKQTVVGHLDKLMDAGLVRSETVEQGGREVPRYSVNPQRLYAVTEELRRLSIMYAGRGLGEDFTGTLAAPTPRARVKGPRLVLVHGVYEGKAYSLDAATARAGRWLIGRSAEASVSLDYDPFVSVENTAIEASAGRFTVVDLPGSKNGTAVNWAPLPRGGRAELHNGDVIGVGRSLLLYLSD